jgi:hypothetical protein
MARRPNNPRHNSAQVPTYKINPDRVEDAWQAYAALQRAACESPALLDNAYFTALQDTAYARFLMTFEAL